MSLKYLGSYTIGGLIPLLPSLATTLGSAVGFFAGESASLELSKSLRLTTPSIPTMTSALNAALTALGTVSVPTMTAGLEVGLNARAGLLAGIHAGLIGTIDLIESVVLTSGILVYTYDGSVSDFGSSLDDSTAGGLPDGTNSVSQCYGIVIVTSSSATWTTMRRVFGL